MLFFRAHIFAYLRTISNASARGFQTFPAYDQVSSIMGIYAIPNIIAYFIIYLREKEGNKDKNGDKDR